MDDLAATVAKKNSRARVLKFPAIDEDGEALVPELHPFEKLLEVKALLSPGQWSALYQQTPIAEGGNIFQEDWIRRWDASTYPAVFRRGDCFMGHDLQGYGRAPTMSSGRYGGGSAPITTCSIRSVNAWALRLRKRPCWPCSPAGRR